MDTFGYVLVYCDYVGDYIEQDIRFTEIDEDSERICSDFCGECDYCPDKD